MSVGILVAAVVFAFPPLATLVVRLMSRQQVRCPGFFRQWAMSGAGEMVGGLIAVLIGGGPLQFLAAVATTVLALILWWLSRRKRKRSLLGLLGYKARALLAVIVRSMPGPGPVLRPVPQGAKA